MSSDGTGQLSFRLDEETARRFRAAVAMEGRVAREVLEGFVLEYLRDHGFDPDGSMVPEPEPKPGHSRGKASSPAKAHKPEPRRERKAK